MMNDSEKNLIRNLTLKKITKENFLKEFSFNPTQDKEYLKKLLRSAYKNKKVDDIYYLLNLASIFELFDQSYVDILCNLLLCDWHFKHEDIARRLQKLKSPKSIEALYQTSTTKFEYLNHDNSYSLARKCMFALGDINTDESVEKLKLLSQSDDEEIKSYAEEQFVREEIKKKL